MDRRAARQTGRCRPQGVIRRRQKQFITVVQQGIGGHDNQFAGTVAQVNVVQQNTLNALFLGFVHHGLSRRKYAFAVRITRRIGQVADHVLLNFLRGVKAKNRQVSDVQFDDFLTVFFHLTSAVHDRATNVITNVGELG